MYSYETPTDTLFTLYLYATNFTACQTEHKINVTEKYVFLELEEKKKTNNSDSCYAPRIFLPLSKEQFSYLFSAAGIIILKSL